MKKSLHFLLQCLVLTPCFSQTIGTEISFSTNSGRVYSGIVTEVFSDTFKVQFQAPGFCLSLATEKFIGTNNKLRIKNGKEITELGDEVEKRLRQEAVTFIEQVFQQCSFPESRTNQCCFRFSELSDCNLYLFYTSKGYDFVGTDYHIVKIDLSVPFRRNPFNLVRSVEASKSNNSYPVVEIAKHTRFSTYDKGQFRDGADWNNQPQYMNDLPLCFLDQSQPTYQNAAEQLSRAFDFLCQSCKKKKR